MLTLHLLLHCAAACLAYPIQFPGRMKVAVAVPKRGPFSHAYTFIAGGSMSSGVPQDTGTTANGGGGWGSAFYMHTYQVPAAENGRAPLTASAVAQHASFSYIYQPYTVPGPLTPSSSEAPLAPQVMFSLPFFLAPAGQGGISTAHSGSISLGLRALGNPGSLPVRSSSNSFRLGTPSTATIAGMHDAPSPVAILERIAVDPSDLALGEGVSHPASPCSSAPGHKHHTVTLRGLETVSQISNPMALLVLEEQDEAPWGDLVGGPGAPQTPRASGLVAGEHDGSLTGSFVKVGQHEV